MPEGFQTIAKRYTAPFGAMGPGGFVVATLTLMGGVAAAPWLLPRVATAPGVYEARKSLGWATFIFGVVMLTVSAVAVFMRDAVMDVVLAGGDGAVAPPWLEQLIQLGFVEVDTRSARLAMTSVAVKRDAVLFSLPIAIGMPAMFFYLMLAGLLAAALAAASATAVALGNVLAEDVVSGLSWNPARPAVRLTIARVAIAAARARRRHCGAGPDRSVAAPVVGLRAHRRGSLSGAGAVGLVETHQRLRRARRDGNRLHGDDARDHRRGGCGWIGFDSALAGMFGLPLAALAAGLVSLITPAPGRNLLELVRDIRVPGGEILYDRETRLARLKQPAPLNPLGRVALGPPSALMRGQCSNVSTKTVGPCRRATGSVSTLRSSRSGGATGRRRRP